MTAAAAMPEPALDRFQAPLYTYTEAARYLDVPTSTLSDWARGYTMKSPGRAAVKRAAVITAFKPDSSRGPRVPFIGLAEGLVLAAFRKSGVPLQRIRPAIDMLRHEVGIEHVLASKKLYTDGAEVLYDYSEIAPDQQAARAVRELVVVRNRQRVFNEVVESYLSRLEFGPDGYPQLLRLPAYSEATVIVDPTRGFGQPIFANGGARVEDALALFQSGERIETVSQEFGVPTVEIEDAIRIAARIAA